jgi:hypothetical protein
MITLASDCLVFRLASGESVPFSAEMISVELMGSTADMFDQDFVRHAASAVFHYFKHDLGLKSVTVGEFAGALESVLRGFVLAPKSPPPPASEIPDPASPSPAGLVLESDLSQLARESGGGCELFFFPRLREELRHQLQHSPRVLRFHSLRGCVKQLVGARKWTARCGGMRDQIVGFLRECLASETNRADFSLVVD